MPRSSPEPRLIATAAPPAATAPSSFQVSGSASARGLRSGPPHGCRARSTSRRHTEDARHEPDGPSAAAAHQRQEQWPDEGERRQLQQPTAHRGQLECRPVTGSRAPPPIRRELPAAWRPCCCKLRKLPNRPSRWLKTNGTPTRSTRAARECPAASPASSHPPPSVQSSRLSGNMPEA